MHYPTQRLLLAGAALLIASASAFAQGGRVGRIVVGFAPGGTTDTVARIVAEQIRHDGGPNLVVDNKTGAGGRIAVEAVKAAEPDGNTILLTPSSMMMVYPFVYRNLRYDPQADFAPLSKAVTFPLGIAVSAGSGIDSFQELVQRMKTDPARASMGTPGAGTVPHFMTLQLKEATGVNIVHAPYRGGPPAIADLMAGQIGAVINPIGDFLPLQQDRKLKIVAVSSPERSPLLPQVPTLRELGYNQLAATEWYAFFLPARTPQPVVQRLNAAIAKALQSGTVKDRLTQLGFEVRPSTPQELAEQLRQDMAQWGPIVKRSGFVAEE